ncbi:MAG: hypothetical protein IPH94_03730 [Saprospiraceae bacterium]|nr:hypothetical protein [Saprospiraceae bacterium]
MKRLVFLLPILLFFQPCFSQNIIDYYTIPGLVVGSGNGNVYEVDTKSGVYFDRREDDTTGVKVYFRGTRTHFESVLLFKENKIYSAATPNDNSLYFDFNLNAGDTIKMGTFFNNVIDSITTIQLLNGEVRPKYVLRNLSIYFQGDITHFVPGLGDLRYGFYPFRSFEGSTYFICAKAGSEQLWVNPNVANLCDVSTCIHPNPQFLHEVVDSTIIFTNISKYANIFEWILSDGTKSVSKDFSHQFLKTGCYSATLKAYNGCATTPKETSKPLNVCSENAWIEGGGHDSMTFYFRRYRITPQIEIISDEYRVLKTIDGGKSYTVLNVQAEDGKRRRVNHFIWWDENRLLALCNHENTTSDQRSILLSEDGGLSWVACAPESYYVSNGATGKNGEAWISEGNYRYWYYRTLDYGKTWEKINLAVGYQIYGFSSLGNNVLYGSGYYGLQPSGYYCQAKSVDNGVTWTFKTYPHGIYATHFFDQNTGYGTKDGKLYETTDGGVTYTLIPTPLKIKSIKLASEKAGWIVDELNTIYYSNDYFHTFTATNCGKAEINFSVFNDSTAYGATLSNYSLGIKPIKVDFNPTMVGCALNFDNDGDGYKASVDCDDQDAGINPGKAEIPYNGTNDDCNTATLDDDLDGDGYGIAQDCDDTNIEVNPGATEIINNAIDENCDGLVEIISGEHHEFTNQLLIYPNPAGSILYYKSSLKLLTATILEVDGRRTTLNLNNGAIDLSAFSNGIKVIEVISEKGDLIYKSIAIHK